MSINKERVHDAELLLSRADTLNNRYILVQKGKKDYSIIVVEG